VFGYVDVKKSKEHSPDCRRNLFISNSLMFVTKLKLFASVSE
jgi:hypothetical protein